MVGKSFKANMGMERKSGNKIVDQLKKLGTAVDWSISKFTLDEECNNAVKKHYSTFNEDIFIKMKG